MTKDKLSEHDYEDVEGAEETVYDVSRDGAPVGVLYVSTSLVEIANIDDTGEEGERREIGGYNFAPTFIADMRREGLTVIEQGAEEDSDPAILEEHAAEVKAEDDEQKKAALEAQQAKNAEKVAAEE